jgi:hypothetical protein
MSLHGRRWPTATRSDQRLDEDAERYTGHVRLGATSLGLRSSHADVRDLAKPFRPPVGDESLVCLHPANGQHWLACP